MWSWLFLITFLFWDFLNRLEKWRRILIERNIVTFIKTKRRLLRDLLLTLWRTSKIRNSICLKVQRIIILIPWILTISLIVRVITNILILFFDPELWFLVTLIRNFLFWYGFPWGACNDEIFWVESNRHFMSVAINKSTICAGKDRGHRGWRNFDFIIISFNTFSGVGLSAMSMGDLISWILLR